MSEYNRHKFAMEWMYGGGRDPNGRGLDEEIQIADDMWKERISMAEGGTPQLVQPGPGRQGYNGREDYKKKWYADNKERILKKRKESYDETPIEEKRKGWEKRSEWQQTEEGKKVRSEQHKKRILEKNPLSKVDQSVLKDFEINLKYLKHINEIIKENGGVRPNPETLSDLIEIRVETDPDLRKLLGNKPFSTKNLSPASFRNKYNRSMAGTKRVTADNFKKAITDLFETELKGSGTSFDDFIKNDFKLTETFLVDQVDSPKAQYQRRYKEILKGKPGWTPEGKGSWAWFANPEQKGTTVTTNLNKRLKLDKLSKEGKSALEFVRSHYFGNIQGKKLYDLGLLDEDAAKNWKERYTWKPRYINDLQSMTYDRDVYKALMNYTKHQDKSKLASEINGAAAKAKKLGLDVDELKLNPETGKFNFLDKKRIIQTGGDRETRYLVQNAMNEIASVQSSTTKELSDDVIKRINQDYGKRGEKIINQVKKGSTHFYPDTPRWSQRIKKFKPKISGAGELYSFPANLPAMFKKMGALPRKVLGWTGADIGFYYLDKWNEMSKGKSEKEAAGIALDNATLGAYNNKTYIEGLKKTAKEMGIDPRAFESVYKMNEKMGKVQKQHETYQKRIEKLKGMEASPERDEMLERITNAYNKWQEGMEPEIDKWVQGIVDDISISKTGGIASPLELSKAAGSITDNEWYGAFGNLQKAAIEKLRQEKAAAYDMQSRQVDPEAGNIGNWLNTNIFTLDAPGKIKEQERIDDMVAFDPKELYRYNLARGLDPDAPITQAAYENLMYEHPGLGFNKGGRASYLDGGIASLKKK